MKKSGFDYAHPDDVEPDIRARLAALTNKGTILVDKMSAEQHLQLKQLQDFERRVALKYTSCRRFDQPCGGEDSAGTICAQGSVSGRSRAALGVISNGQVRI